MYSEVISWAKVRLGAEALAEVKRGGWSLMCMGSCDCPHYGATQMLKPQLVCLRFCDVVCQVRTLLRVRSNWLIFLQGLPGSLPWGMML